MLPDVSVGALVLHSERLTRTVATHAADLAAAKVTAADQRALTDRIAALRATETAWKKARAAAAPGAVAQARDALTLGREDLVGALRAFADHDDATQHALDAIAGVEGDDDLEARGLTGDRSPRPTKTPRSRCRHPHLTGTTAACG